MATLNFDNMCVEFIKRIPDQLETSFTPGTEVLPDGYNILAATIIEYINRGMQELFRIKWDKVNGDMDIFIQIFPELIKMSAEVDLPTYAIANPHKDFYKVLGGITSTGSKLIKRRPETEYMQFLTGKYRKYQATANDLVIIQNGLSLVVFPSTSSGKFKFQYIKRPVDPTTGLNITQNGSYDSPYYEFWHKEIVEIAYNLFLKETADTQ